MSRPKDRNECRDGVRPCPWLSCKYHLGLDVTEADSVVVLGSDGKELKWGGRDGDPSDAELEAAASSAVSRGETCCLDVADKGGATLQEIGELMGVTRERIRQIESKAIRRLKQTGRRGAGQVRELRKFTED